jgi:RsiW-degrading membrane proteinase PrsW (M82 family)
MNAVLFSTFLLVLGLVPSFAWLLFYRHEHMQHPEPRRMLFFSFIIGGLTTFAVLPVQIFLNARLLDIGVQGLTFTSFMILAATEEIIKFAGAYLLIKGRSEFHEPLNAMVYMIAVALGFAAVENVASLFQIARTSSLSILLLESVALRFVGATLLHTLASGIVGYYWGLLAFLRPKHKFLLLLEGLAIATVLHAIFNYLIIKDGPAGFAIVFVVVVAFFVLNDFEKFKKIDTAPSS